MGRIGLIFLLAAATQVSPVRAEEMVDVTIRVQVVPERIVFQELIFRPETVETRVSRDWVETVEVRTNFYYGMKPDEVVTNSVRRQVAVESAVTNAAMWTAPFEYTIPAGEQMLMAGALEARPQRKAVMDVQLVLSAGELRVLLGDDFYLQTQAAAETFGPLPVKGDLKAALQAAVLQNMGGML